MKIETVYVYKDYDNEAPLSTKVSIRDSSDSQSIVLDQETTMKIMEICEAAVQNKLRAKAVELKTIVLEQSFAALTTDFVEVDNNEIPF